MNEYEDKYEMILPPGNALPVSHRSANDEFGLSFISRKDAHSLLR